MCENTNVEVIFGTIPNAVDIEAKTFGGTLDHFKDPWYHTDGYSMVIGYIQALFEMGKIDAATMLQLRAANARGLEARLEDPMLNDKECSVCGRNNQPTLNLMRGMIIVDGVPWYNPAKDGFMCSVCGYAATGREPWYCPCCGSQVCVSKDPWLVKTPPPKKYQPKK